MNKPKALFIQTFSPGVTYYRMYCFAQRMSELGLIHSRMFPIWDPSIVTNPVWEDHLTDYREILKDAVYWADIIISQYVSTSDGFGMIKTIAEFKPVLMEVDDYFKQIPIQHPAFENCTPGQQQDYWATRQFAESRAVICSTPYLAKMFNEYNPNTYVVPNCIDFDFWDSISTPSPNGKVTIGWIGGASHASDLKLCKEALYEIMDEFDNVEVKIVSCPPPPWEEKPNLKLLNKWSTIDKYPNHVKGLGLQIGLAPLRDNYFNRGKSNLRYLEYSACSIPTVASDVEPFRDKFEGVIARTQQDWYGELKKLVTNESYRQHMGCQAYESIKSNFNLTDVSRHYAEVIRSLI